MNLFKSAGKPGEKKGKGHLFIIDSVNHIRSLSDLEPSLLAQELTDGAIKFTQLKLFSLHSLFVVKFTRNLFIWPCSLTFFSHSRQTSALNSMQWIQVSIRRRQHPDLAEKIVENPRHV